MANGVRRESQLLADDDNNQFYTNIGSSVTSSDDGPSESRSVSRLCVVRYFLDRPGYHFGSKNSAARLWFNPPAECTPHAVHEFLKQQGIAMDGLLVEVYLDKFESFMMLEVCESSMIRWDFSKSSRQEPSYLNIRLTDMTLAQWEEQHAAENETKFPLANAQQQQEKQQLPNHANTTPVGLFSFSIMNALEAAALMSRLIPGSVDPSFVLVWGPSMFFIGGIVMFIVGSFQVLRNNLYGATAFIAFGSIWISSGTNVILNNYFAVEGTRADILLESSDHLGSFIRSFFILGLCCALLKATLVMNKLSSLLISLLCIKVGAGCFSGWSRAMEWIQLVFGCLTALMAFYVFLVEFTNQIYHREVFRTFKWSEKHSPEEVFGATGRGGTLNSKAARLRQAHFPTPRKVREASCGEITS